MAYRWLRVFEVSSLPLFIVIRSAQSSTSVQLDVEIVFVLSGAIDVNAILVVGITCACVNGEAKMNQSRHMDIRSKKKPLIWRAQNRELQNKRFNITAAFFSFG